MNNAPSTVGPDAAISPEVVEHVKSVAASMIGHAAFQKCDFDDICQDLFQQIILATPNFDPAKSSFATYACQIADRYKNRIYRERIYEKRDLPTIPFENRDEEPSQYEIDTAVNNVEHQCLIEDVHAVVASLSPIQKNSALLSLKDIQSEQLQKSVALTLGVGVIERALSIIYAIFLCKTAFEKKSKKSQKKSPTKAFFGKILVRRPPTSSLSNHKENNDEYRKLHSSDPRRRISCGDESRKIPEQPHAR